MALPYDSVEWYIKSSEIGDAITQGMHFILSHGISMYPDLKELGCGSPISPYDRFQVSHESDKNQIVITDQVNLAILCIDTIQLENPYFDAIRWLAKNLNAFVAMQYESLLLDELQFEKLKCAEAIKVCSEQWRMQ